MKKIKIQMIALLAASLFISGCDKMMDVPAESVITASSFWKTEDDAKAGLNGAYMRLRSALSGFNFFIWGDFRTGFYGNPPAENGYVNYGKIWDNNIDPSTNGTNWSSIYTCINACNLILDHVPDIGFQNDANKSNILGQAHFIRAYCYWWLVRLWGEVPLMTIGVESDDEEILYPSRQPVDKVFELIESDLSEAASTIGSSNGLFKGNLPTVYLLQADVYLWQYKVNGKGKDYVDKASQALSNFESKTTASLSASYENVFRKDNDPEIVFSIPFIQNENESGANMLVPIISKVSTPYQNNPVPVGASTQWTTVTDAHHAFLHEDESDTRADVNAKIFNAPTGEVYKWVNKYLGTWASGTRYYDSDYRLYRYADAVMLKAEIQNELGNQTNAIAAVNQIAKRAYGKDNYYGGSYSKAEVDEIIINERMKEFCSEGKTWFDLIRMGKAFEKVPTLAGKENKKNILFWPVANASINYNPNITQTEGY